MLKLKALGESKCNKKQPPSGGCVLKLVINWCGALGKLQPPSGGCVLKLMILPFLNPTLCAAAFGRLCVETIRNRQAEKAE